MKIYNDDTPVIIVDRDFNIVRLNKKAQKEYREVAGQKCYSVFNGFNQPCYRATQYICPIKILLDTDSDRYTGVYSLSSKPGKYVVITVERDGDYFVHTHRILDRHQLELIDFKKIFNFLSEGLVLVDKKTERIKFLNSQFLKIFEINSDGEEFIDRDIAYLNRELPDEIKGIFYRDEMIPDYQEFVSHYRGRYLVIRKVSIDDRYVLWSFEEKKETDLSDEIFRVLLEMTPVGIFLQCDGKFMYVNPTLASILETVPGELIGSSVFGYIHPDDREKVREIVERRNRGEKFKAKYIARIITGKGNVKWVELTSDTIYFRGKSCGIGSCVDVTEMKELEDNLRRLATIDQLTGIYNRYSFEKFLEEEIYKAERYGSLFALIMFDIDNFKQINDHYGHQVGDRVLKELVKIVKDTIRKSDIFARWGGEEFMILAPVKDKKDAYRIAEKIRTRIENYRFENVGKLTISLGISFYKKGDTIKSLIRRADTALYEAKKTGKNKTVIAD